MSEQFIYLGSGSIREGNGSPEGVISANIGSLYLRKDGGTGTSFYVKESGTLNTGWAAVSAAVASSLASTLAVGNITGGTSIVVSSGDLIRGVDAAAGTNLALRGGNGSGTTGGNVSITSGTATSGSSGTVTITTSTTASGGTGAINLTTGNATTAGNPAGNIVLTPGSTSDAANAGTGSGGKGGYVEVYGGVGNGAGQGGDLTFYSGNGGSSGNSGVFECAIGTPGTGASAGNFLFSGRSGDTNNTEVHFRTNGTDYLIFYDNGTIHFPVDSSGNIEASDAVAASTNPGGSLIFSAGKGDGTGIGGDIAINGGYGGATAVGGNITLTAGHGGSGSGTGGNTTILGGFGLASGESGGAVYCTGGAANSTSGGFGGEIVVSSGSGGTTGIGGAATLVAGNGGSTSGDAGNAYLRGGAVTDGNGGRVYIEGTSGAGGFGNGGFIECKLGAASGGSDSYFNVVNTGGTQLLKVLYTGGLHAFYTVTPITDTGVTLTNDDTRTLTTNEGAAALTDRTLPSAVAGTTFTFYCQDADGIKVIANTGDTIRLSAGVSATAGYVKSTVVGSLVTLVAINATEWVRISEFGTWTIDS